MEIRQRRKSQPQAHARHKSAELNRNHEGGRERLSSSHVPNKKHKIGTHSPESAPARGWERGQGPGAGAGAGAGLHTFSRRFDALGVYITYSSTAVSFFWELWRFSGAPRETCCQFRYLLPLRCYPTDRV